MTTWTNSVKPTTTVEYIATEALDFLMTEDGFYLITDQSNVWSGTNKPSTSWSGITKPTL